ncbi:putative ABC transporter-binding protein [bacterium HR37]|nr:putative ABC transporter-binding protein [bacterium HR37]
MGVKRSIELTFFCFIVLLFAFSSCDKKDLEENNKVTIVFKYGKLFGDPEPLEKLIKEFESLNPDIRVKDEVLPATTDEQHQFYVINLEAGSKDFDVFSLDVIWIPEFVRAGWLRDLTHIVPPELRKEFFQGPMEVAMQNGRVYAVPWYIDAGVLYYRKDLLSKYGFSPPRTWGELVYIASEIMRKEPGIYGFLWQGKQYEGLVCNVLEYIWGNGGSVVENGKIVIDSPNNKQALGFVRDLIHKYGVTPEFVTTMTEDSTTRIFAKGRAIFMRNWPYAWNILEREDSPVKGKVGFSMLPSFPGYSSFSTLGGWFLGINNYSKHPRESEKFVRFLSSYRAQKLLSLTVGYRPTLKRIYRESDIVKTQPLIAHLYKVFEHARPRPVTPFYMVISQVMQSEFSAVITGVRNPEDALKSAKKHIEFILGTGY